MEEKLRELSKERFNKAIHNMELAEKLIEDKEYGYAQNRIYYAVFDALR